MNRPELDYYAVLDIPRSTTKQDITLAYRRLAIRLCPHRDKKDAQDFVPLAQEGRLTHLSPMGEAKQWAYVNMAFDVLGNDLYRAIYDRYGEAGLFEGVMLPNGYFPPYQYHGEHMKVYESVFASYSPYANVIDAITNPPSLYSTKKLGIGVRSKDADTEKIIQLSLEEVRSGCVKLMHVWRQEIVDAKESRLEKRKHTLKLNIAPGTTAGTRFCFKEEGDRYPASIPGDVIFIAADKPHPEFERRNLHDLVYRYNIDLGQAMTGFIFFISTLDKRQLKIVITDVVHQGYCKVIPLEGLPKCRNLDAVTAIKEANKKNDQFGDLIIEFNYIFPKYLTPTMKSMTREFFREFHKLEVELEEEEKQKML
ncbi:dnaJ homolog subfamily B member 13 [Drosophila pseudoobscura]|uniref:DnaJ homolog subfamily B member 13 n=1 Tax=Drosophila pseudoobscura pseudoobscura TaxID=46245 RepID=Q2M070_DROPS|nr:dnaJ homolog subfamily B member 13 [Drosophila pseudoobscura]